MTIKEQKRLDKKELNRKLKEWKESALLRANNKCQSCFTLNHSKVDKNGRKIGLNCHHIIPKEVSELRVDLDNAVVLCPNCHKYNKWQSFHKNPFYAIHRFRLSSDKNEEQLKRLMDKYLRVMHSYAEAFRTRNVK